MDFSLSSDQRSFQDIAKQFAHGQLAPYAQSWDAQELFPIPTMKEAAKLGFASLMVDESFGGCGLKRLDSVVVFEELAKGCVSTAGYLSVHNMVSYLINRFGSRDQHQMWLPKLASLEWFASYCLTEPEAGSDAASLNTKAVREGDFYIVDGGKVFISGGGHSDLYLCMVRTGEEGPNGITALVIEKGTPGLSFGKKEEKMGWRNQPTTSVMFDQVRVPVSNRIGEEGQGFKIAMHGLDGGRLNIAACSLGGAQHCLDLALSYMNERKQFGKKLNEFQALQFRLSDMVTELTAARLMVHKAASALDEGQSDATFQCAMAKRFATDVGFKVVNEALQLYGGYGYIKDYQIERYLRDLRVHQILEGTNEIMRLIIARHLIKQNEK
jgi:hypothetical protein